MDVSMEVLPITEDMPITVLPTTDVSKRPFYNQSFYIGCLTDLSTTDLPIAELPITDLYIMDIVKISLCHGYLQKLGL